MFPQSFSLIGDVELNEISIPSNSGLGGEPGVYPVFAQSGNTITIPNTATDFPQIDYEIPQGDLTLIEDPDDDNNIVIVIPETTSAPPKLLENRQMLIEAGTVGNEQDVQLPILRVDGHQITIPNFLGWVPNEQTIPSGEELTVVLHPDDGNIVEIEGYPPSVRYGRIQLTLPVGFLGLESEFIVDTENFECTQGGRTYLCTTFENELLASKEDELIKASTNAITLKSGPGLEFQTFSTREFVYLNIPLDQTDPRISVTGGATANDVTYNSVLNIPASTVGSSNFGDTTAAPAPAMINLSPLRSGSTPHISNGTDSVFAPPNNTSRWVGIDKRRLPDGSPFKNWGIVESFERRAVNVHPSNSVRLFTSAVGTSEFDRIFDLAIPQVDQKDPQLADEGDWVDIPPGAFSTVYQSWVINLGFGGNQEVGRTFNTSTTFLTGPISSFSTSSVGNLVNHKMYNFIVSTPTYNNYGPRQEYFGRRWGEQYKIQIIRPTGRVAFANDAVLQVKPSSSYKLPGDLKIRYLDDTITLIRPIKIGRYRGEKRLTRDLYVYNTAKEIISSDTFTTPNIETYTFNPVRITFADLRGVTNQNLRITLIDTLTPDEQQYLLNGNLGSGTFDIPADVTFLGLSGVSLEYQGIAQLILLLD